MRPPLDVVRSDFDRIARHSRGLPDRIEPATERLLAAVPPGRTRVVEVGCGTGALARRLAMAGARVTAIDLSPRMIDVARVRTPKALAIDYRVGDFMAWAPRGFDVAITVATLHHLALADALARLAAAVVPGGVVLIADLFTAPGVFDLPYNAASWLDQRLGRLGRGGAGRSAGLGAAWAAHGAHDDLLTMRATRAAITAALPGAVIRRHLGWRYTAIWTRPR